MPFRYFVLSFRVFRPFVFSWFKPFLTDKAVNELRNELNELTLA